MDLLTDFDELADVPGFSSTAKRLISHTVDQAKMLGNRYELESAATLKRNGFIVTRLGRKLGKSDVDIELAGDLYCQCKKSGGTVGTWVEVDWWVNKCREDMARKGIDFSYSKIKYILPPDEIANLSAGAAKYIREKGIEIIPMILK